MVPFLNKNLIKSLLEQEKLRLELIVNPLNHKLYADKVGAASYQLIIINEQLEVLENLNKTHLMETKLSRDGGQWLGETRSWIQQNCINGSDVCWDSSEFLKVKDLTVQDLQLFGSRIAAAAIKDVLK